MKKVTLKDWNSKRVRGAAFGLGTKTPYIRTRRGARKEITAGLAAELVRRMRAL